MGNAEVATAREMAPAITGRDQSDQDPPIMEQLTNEIGQAREFIEQQTIRVRNHSDRLFGPEPQQEKGEDKNPVAEVRPSMELLGAAIRHLHHATQALSRQVDRLEGHRLV